MLQQRAHCAWATTVVKLIIFVAYGARWVCLCYYNPLNSEMDHKIFTVRRDVKSCDCTSECTDTEIESALKIDSRKKIPLPHQGIEPASAAWRSSAQTNWATSHPQSLWYTLFLAVGMAQCTHTHSNTHTHKHSNTHSNTHTHIW